MDGAHTSVLEGDLQTEIVRRHQWEFSRGTESATDDREGVSVNLVAKEVDEVATLALQSPASADRIVGPMFAWKPASVYPVSHQLRTGQSPQLSCERSVPSVETHEQWGTGAGLCVLDVAQACPVQRQGLFHVYRDPAL